MGRASLLVRALWWRRGFSIALVLVATITSAAAALGPIYARAAGESVLADRLNQAPTSESGLSFQEPLELSDAGALDAIASEAPAPGAIRGFPARIVTGAVPVTASGVAGAPSSVSLVVSRPGSCAHLIFLQGRCPVAGNEVAVSDRTASASSRDQWRIGGTVNIDDSSVGLKGLAASANAPRAKVVGVYRPRDVDDPFWFDEGYFDAHVGSGAGGEGSDTIDSLFATPAGLQSLTQGAPGTAYVDYPPDPAQIRLDDLSAVAAHVAALQDSFGIANDLVLRTGFSDLVAQERAEQRLLDGGTLLVTLQLTVLALLVLFQVMSEAVEARGNEIALAKLRGLGPFATIRFGLAEPVVLLLLGLPLGLGTAYVAARLLASSVLAPGTPVAIRLPVLLALAAALAGGLVATAVAARRTLTRPVLEQWRRTASVAGPRRLALVLDGVVAVAAVVGLIVLLGQSHRGHPGTGALVAPALLVFAVALLGVRLIPRLGRAVAGPTRSGRRIGLFLASRQLARRPGPLRLAALLAVAVGLASFAIAGESVARANRIARAQAELGAPAVASVQYAIGHDPVAITRAVDPSGRWAMAAADWLSSGGGAVIGTVLGVDSSRLSSVAYRARGAPPLAAVVSTIQGRVQPSVALRGTRVSVTLDVQRLAGAGVPGVGITIRQADSSVVNVALGTMRRGSASYSAALPCTAGCQLVGLTWIVPLDVSTPVTGRVVVSALTVDGQAVNTRLTTVGAWRGSSPNPRAVDRPRVTSAGLEDDFSMNGGLSAMIGYADRPAVLPVVSSDGGINYLNGAMVDTIGTSLNYHADDVVPILPAVEAAGLIGDLTYLRTSLYGFDGEASWQVWLGPDAPHDAVDRLTRAGLLVQSVTTEHHRVLLLGRQGPALALLLLLATAIAGSVLAVGGTAVAITASGRRRSFELAALRVVGVRRSTLLGASLIEQLILLGSGLVLGVPTGWIAARLTMPVIAEFSDPTSIQLKYVPSAPAVLAYAGAFLVLLAVTALVAARSLVALAAPMRLREAEA